MNEMTWEEIKDKPTGHIFHTDDDKGIRFIIMRGPCSLCAYIGVPKDHVLAGFDYEDLPGIDCHGGLTYAGADELRGEDRYWYGWDYSHCDDYSFYYDDYPSELRDGKKWLVEDVIKDSYWTRENFKNLVHFAEDIKRKSK